ncbi:MAG: polysaccharide pyruvyl transferase family protein [Halomonas sp.]|nr:polysaccharide pyruvyl transferase family protein [Halomonas sp.]TVP45508.1 MAG: polysaccharide pyruvyl transferase family protein [Halomonas sp.]
MEKWLNRLNRVRPGALANSVRVAVQNDPLVAAWARSGHIQKNWGDALNPVLIEMVSGRVPYHSGELINIRSRPVYYVIGSGLGNINSQSAQVWGMGFRTEQAVPKVKPAKIHAVRGPLSRKKYLEAGIDCPEIYGDPALLFPRFYNPVIEKRHAVGVIAHISERESPYVKQLVEGEGAKFIDVTLGVNEFVDELLACSTIVSSSLHGLIAADGYGVPSVWASFGEKPESWFFKFRDYMESTGRSVKNPVKMTSETKLSELLDHTCDGPLGVDIDRLLECCPFRSAN